MGAGFRANRRGRWARVTSMSRADFARFGPVPPELGRPKPRYRPPTRDGAIVPAAMAEPLTITILEGDETGQELLEQALRVLDPDVIGLDLRLDRFDLSLASRRATGNEIVHEAARAIAILRPRRQSGHDHAREQRRRRLAESDPPREGRRQGDHPHRPSDPRSHALRRPSCTRSRSCEWPSRTPTAQRSRARASRRARRGRLPHRADHARHLPRCRRVRLPHRRAFGRLRLWRPEMDRVPGLRGHAQGGDRSPPPPRTPTSLPAGADRRDLCGPDQRRARRTAGDPGAEPRRRLPLRPRAADVRLDRRRRVGAAELRRRVQVPESRWPRLRTAPPRRFWARTSPTRWRCCSRAAPSCTTPPITPAQPRPSAPPRPSTTAVLRAAADGIQTPDLGGHASTTEFTDDVVRRVRAATAARRPPATAVLLRRKHRTFPACTKNSCTNVCSVPGVIVRLRTHVPPFTTAPDGRTSSMSPSSGAPSPWLVPFFCWRTKSSPARTARRRLRAPAPCVAALPHWTAPARCRDAAAATLPLASAVGQRPDSRNARRREPASRQRRRAATVDGPSYR